MITRHDIEKDLHDWKNGKMGYDALMNAIDMYAENKSQPSDVVDFLDSIREYEKENGSRICFDERTSSELYQLFINEKRIGK